MSATELEAFLDTEIDMNQYEEVMLALLAPRGGDEDATQNARQGSESQAPATASEGA